MFLFGEIFVFISSNEFSIFSFLFFFMKLFKNLYAELFLYLSLNSVNPIIDIFSEFTVFTILSNFNSSLFVK